MILNTYAILLGFLALLQLLVSGLVLVTGGLACRGCMKPLAAEERTALEHRSYLLLLLTMLVLGVNLASWPLLYLLLQSYVPEWSGVMCIYGVMQVGKGSMGPSRYLPGLLAFLQAVKPALVFLGGAWFTLYLLNRRTRTAPLMRRILLLLVPLAILAAADAAAELAYIGIPKKEEFPTSGCCTMSYEQPATSPLAQPATFGRGDEQWLSTAYFAVNIALLLALLASSRLTGTRQLTVAMAALLCLGLIAAWIAKSFLVDVAAPALLHLPYHHCPYDLLPQAPEAVLAIVYFVGGCFFLGWAAVVCWLGRGPETEPFLSETVRTLLRASFWSILLSVVLLSLELALA